RFFDVGREVTYRLSHIRPNLALRVAAWYPQAEHACHTAEICEMNGSGPRGRDRLLARPAVMPLMAWTICAAMLGSAAPVLAAPAQVASVFQGNGNCATQLPATSLDQAVPWAQRALNFQHVWPITEGAGVTVAVVDTGVDATQPFLEGAVLP